MEVHECANWRTLRDRWANFSNLDSHIRQQWWFRGSGDANRKLDTTLDRRFKFGNDEDRNECVNELLVEFKRELLHVGEDTIIELRGEALELLARHYGLPSPLMDWTESPYIASYFVFEDAIRIGSDRACIWALNRARFVPSADTIDFVDDFELLKFNKRALHQRGVFLRISTIKDSVINILDDALLKIVIPSTEAKFALVDLELMTANATYLFCGEEGAARTATMRVDLKRM